MFFLPRCQHFNFNLQPGNSVPLRKWRRSLFPQCFRCIAHLEMWTLKGVMMRKGEALGCSDGRGSLSDRNSALNGSISLLLTNKLNTFGFTRGQNTPWDAGPKGCFSNGSLDLCLCSSRGFIQQSLHLIKITTRMTEFISLFVDVSTGSKCVPLNTKRG